MPPTNVRAREATGDFGRHRVASLGLLVLMACLSLFMWIGVPFGWMWLASKFVFDTQAHYLLLLLLVPVTMVGVGWVIYRLNAVYVRVSGEGDRPRHSGWLKSQAGDRTTKPPKRAIDVIMSVSVGLALLAFAFWFFFLAGSPLAPMGVLDLTL